MTERSKPPTQPPDSRAYKRSWKNLLLNKRYQLRFTLFMVGLAGVLMAGLGYWVMFYADRTTTIGINRVISEPCPEVPRVGRLAQAMADRPAATPDAPTAAQPAPGADGQPPRARVTIEESSLEITVRAPRDFADQAAARWGCELRHTAAVENLRTGRAQILLVLFAAGLVLAIGLGIYGIKMTHKVAGPLYKLTLYFAKMRDGRLDKVYNLRKGDQLIDFYEHFKTAHLGVVAIEHGDVARLKAVLAVIDKDPAKFGTPELAGHVAELRAIVARKESSLE